MNKKAKKAYNKAMYYYEKGKINRALEICEEVLIEGLDNSAALNFKGLLLYQKGNLTEAITVWKMNRDLNNDDIAKNYIKDAMADEVRLELYKQGEQALRQLKIDKALDLFNRCSESGFNAIKVNTGIAICYQKKGDLYKAKEYVDKALNVDKDAVTAKTIEKELKEDGIYLKESKPSKGFLITITILFLVVAIITGGYLIISKIKAKDLTNNIEEAKNNEIQGEKGSTIDDSKEIGEQEKVEMNSKITSQGIDKENLKTLIDSNDLDGVYEQLKDVKEESISNEDDQIYKQAINLMKSQGVSKFYEYGLWYFNQKDYAHALESLDKAYAYCDGSSIKEHILFYRASSSSNQSDNKTALAQYEEYYKQYPKGVYTEESLYDLALLSNAVDKEKSKIYANALINNFPKSIYINDNIVSIIRS